MATHKVNDYIAQRRKALGLDRIAKVDQEYIDTFVADAQSHLDSKNLTGDISSAYDSWQKADRDLRARSTSIRQYLQENKSSITKESYKSMMGFLDDFGRASAQFGYSLYDAERKASINPLDKMTSDDILAEWDKVKTANAKSEKEYNERLAAIDAELTELRKQPYAGRAGFNQEVLSKIQSLEAERQQLIREYKPISEIAYTTESGRNVTWEKLYNNKLADEELDRLYSEYSAQDDWKNLSQDRIPGIDYASDFGILWELSLSDVPYDADHVDNNPDAKFNFQEVEKKRKYIEDKYGVNLHDGDGFETILYLLNKAEGGNDTDSFVHFDYASQMDEKEKSLLNYIFNTQGYYAAYDFHNTREEIYLDRHIDTSTANAIAWGEEHPVLASIASIPLSVVSGVEFVGDTIAQGFTGERQYNDLAGLSSGLRGGVMEGTDLKIGDFDAFDFLYGTGMSGLDSVISVAVFGNLGGAALGLSAAGQSYNDAINRGMSEDQALTTGIAAGVFEGLFETISIGKLKGMQASGKKGFVNGVLDYARLAGVNASEEMLTEIANISYDTLANGGFSQYETSVRQYMNAGMSEEEARKKAGQDLAAQVGEAAASGALMGVGFGALGNMGNRISNYKQDVKVGKRMVGAAQAAGNFDSISALKSLAYEMADKLKTFAGKQLAKTAGKINYADLNARQVGKTARLLAESVSSQNAADIQTALTENGISKKVAARLAEHLAEGNLAEYAKEVAKLDKADQVRAEDAFANTIVDPLSSVNVRLQKVASAEQGVYSRESAPMTSDQAVPEVLKGDHKVSEEGKTLYTNENGETEEVKISKIVSTEDGIKVALDNGKTVSVKDLELSSDADAMAFEMITRMETTPETAQVIFEAVKASDATSAEALFIGVTNAYRYGKINYEAGLKKLRISNELKKLAFDRGRADAEANAKSEKQTTTQQAKKTNAKKGKVVFEGFEYSDDKATDMQKASMAGINLLAKLSSVEFHVYASFVENGKRVAIIDGKKQDAHANGYFVGGTNKIYIDLNAGNKGEGTMLYTLAHEVTHYIAAWNKDGFKKLGDFLIANFGQKNVPVATLIAKKQEILIEGYKRDGVAIPSESELFDAAYEEVVAEAMSSMFADPNAYVKLAELKKQDKKLWQKLGEAIKAILAKLKSLLGVYAETKPGAVEADFVAQFNKDVYDKLQDLYLKAFVEADANYQAAQRDGTADKHLKNRHISYNERAIESHKASLLKKHSTDASIDLDTLMQRYDKIISIWKSLGGELDSKFLNEWNNKVGKDRAFTVFKAQSGYKYNVEAFVNTQGKKQSKNDSDSVKRKMQERDSLGNELSAEQQKFFKDSKVRDENGNLLVVYHGSPKGRTTIFDKSKTSKDNDMGQGIYFSTDAENASTYMGETKGKKLYSAYLNFRKPFVVSDNTTMTLEEAQNLLRLCDDRIIASDVFRYLVQNAKDGLVTTSQFANTNASIYMTEMMEKSGKYDGIIDETVANKFGLKEGTRHFIALQANQIKQITNKAPTSNPDIRYQERSTYAPTFYSYMGKVVDGIKSEKIGAGGVIPYLKGKGVKDEEIKWSGIEAFLEGKKSLTKQELQEFVAGSQLQIEEEMSGEDIDLRYDGTKRAYHLLDENGNVLDTFTYNQFLDGYVAESDEEIYSNEHDLIAALREEYGKASAPRWSQYKLDGGSNYRELVFKMPNATYTNRAMQGHWGQDAEGVLAHARIQDFTTSDGKSMLFVEEIQSDWHNAGQKYGYGDNAEALEQARLKQKKLKAEYDSWGKQQDSLREKRYVEIDDYAYQTEMSRLVEKETAVLNELMRVNTIVNNLESGNAGSAPDAPFRDTYHEYVLKRLLRMAAEEGYDSIGWTTADIQSERWSEDYAEGYRIEYDQDIPKFLRKYGKKWGATVGVAYVNPAKNKNSRVAEYERDIADNERQIKEILDVVGEMGRDVIADEQIQFLTEGIEELRAGMEELNGTKVWSMDITDSMKDSVLYEGQVMYQERDPNSLSTRSLLANALESAAQNDIERKKLAQYKSNLALIESEQAKLANLRWQAHELRFKKGRTAEETKKLREIDLEVKQTANRINTYDRQLFNLEATTALKGVLEREKKAAYKKAEQRGRDALKRQREKAVADYRKLVTEHQESRRRASEKRKMSEAREKIKRFKQKMESALEHPTDNAYIPMGLVGAMVDVCSLIDTDTDLYKKDGSLNKAQAKRNETKEKLQALKDEYENLKTNADPLLAGEYEEEVYEYLKDLQDNFSTKSLGDMTLAELEEMYHILKSIDETLRDAKKVIGWSEAVDVYEAGDTIVSEQKRIVENRKGGKRSALQKANDTVINLSLSPVRNVERMSDYQADSPLLKLFKDFERGTRKKNIFMMEALKAFESVTTGENAKAYEDAVYEGFGAEYTDDNGRKFRVSKMQMMQAIMSYEREVANDMHHLEGSGFTFADLELLKKGKLAQAISAEHSHRITLGVEMAQSFAELLKNDKWAQEYMAVARQFFDNRAKNAINETYVTLKHRIIARDKNYIPFEVDKNFVVQEISAEEGIQQTISSYGMLKDKKKGASQPLIITGLNNILERHMEQVGNVVGLAVPVRNFNKVWNVRATDTGFGSDPTVKGAIETAWGKDGKAFIEQTVKDVQGKRPNTQSELYRKVKSNYIGATFLLNGSVVMKQIGSLFASTSMLKWRDPASMLANLVYTMANYKSIAEEVDKYTATAWVRRQGVSDSELHTLTTEAKRGGIAGLFGRLPAVLNPTKWITAMDSAVALSLWKYAKQDTAKRTGLQGEELLKATAEFYDEVVENTQSMADVLHRPEIQKRGDVISEAFGMFKTDLYQMAGQLQVTFGRYQANKSKENGAALGRTVYSILSSAVWASLMTSLFALLRYKVNPYRDEEDDELTSWSWLKRQLSSLFGDILGYIFPLAGSEVAGAIENILFGESDDIVDSLALTAINDLYDALITVGTSVKEGEMPSKEEATRLLVKALQAFGVPSNNISRTLEAIRLHAEDIKNGEFFSFEAGADKSNSQRLYEAILEGDQAKIDRVMEQFEDQDAIASAIRARAKESYVEGELSRSEAEKMLINYGNLDADDAYWKLKEWDYFKQNGSTDGYSKYSTFHEAVQTGRNLKAVIREYTSHGVEAKTLASQITSYFKPLYKEMSKSERASIKGYLLNAYVQLGYNRADKSKDIDAWLKD